MTTFPCRHCAGTGIRNFKQFENDLGHMRQQFQALLGAASDVTGLEPKIIAGESRKARVVAARQVVAHLAYQHTTLSYPELGRLLGNRDHSTIMYADKRAPIEHPALVTKIKQAWDEALETAA